MSSLRLVVGSTNPVKIEAARRAVAVAFPGRAVEAIGVEAASGVADQPRGDAVTLAGAERRAEGAERAAAGDIHVGIEGGVQDREGEMDAFAWVVARGFGRVGRARTATFAVPPAIADLVRAGLELSDADARVLGRPNAKRGDGTVGALSGGVIDRTAYYEHAAVLALIPLRLTDLYPPASAAATPRDAAPTPGGIH